MMPIRRSLLAVLLVATASVVVPLAMNPSTASAQPAYCEPPNFLDERGHCVVVVGIPPENQDPTDPHDPPPTTPRQCLPGAPFWIDPVKTWGLDQLTQNDIGTMRCFGRVCRWWNAVNQEDLHIYYPDARPDAVLQFYTCRTASGPDEGFRMRAADPDEGFGAAPPLPPGVVANWIWIDAQIDLDPPEVVAFPAPGTRTVVHVPTFVSVSNWPEQPVSDSDCDSIPNVCVGIEATPRLTFEPGDGTSVINCTAGGTPFDPLGPPPREQATQAGEGACVHAYTEPTSPGDPQIGKATMIWDVRWWTTGLSPDESGTLPALDMPPVDIPRPVIKLPTLVVEAGLG